MRGRPGAQVRGGLNWRRTTVVVLGAVALCAALAPSATTNAAGVPGIRHVWVVMLENEGYDRAFVTNPNPYLPALAKQGALVQNYYGIGHQSLPNYIALIGGQAPTPQTQADCPTYSDITPGTPGPDPDQVNGQGCVYPAHYITLADQIAAMNLRWKGYMEDLNYEAKDATLTCNPQAAQTGTPDQTQKPISGNDQYATRHDPFMYYHSIIDNHAQCANVVTLQSEANGLRHDLMDISNTPNFSLVIPNLCNDGHDAPCTGPDVKGDTTGGLKAIDDWLSVYVPQIMASPAYQQDGMLVVAFDEAGTNEGASCCNEQPGQNTAAGGPPDTSFSTAGYGGGKVGAVVLSPFVKPGTKPSKSYNHYSLLKSLENMFHTTGGFDKHGHLGYACDDNGTKPYDPGAFGADVFTNPGYVPPPPPAPGTFTLPPVPQPYGPSSSAPAAAEVRLGSRDTPVLTQPQGGTVVAPATPTPSPTPVHWDRSMLASLPGEGGSAGAIAAFVLAPLLVTGAVTLFLRRRGGSG